MRNIWSFTATALNRSRRALEGERGGQKKRKEEKAPTQSKPFLVTLSGHSHSRGRGHAAREDENESSPGLPFGVSQRGGGGKCETVREGKRGGPQ